MDWRARSGGHLQYCSHEAALRDRGDQGLEKDYWDLSGIVQDGQLYLLIGYRVANDPKMPEWKLGAEFKAKRDASLRQTVPPNR